MKLSKTEAGQQAFKARSTLLTARQRSAFILFDGVKSSAQVLTATAGLGIAQSDIDYLVAQGLLMVVPAALEAAADLAPASEAAPARALSVSDRSPQERYRDAMPIATRLTASLGLRGFRLNLAVEAASGYDGLLALLPRIQSAVGAPLCVGLEQALKH